MTGPSDGPMPPGDPSGPTRDETTGLGVRYVGHATVLLDLGAVRLLTDPFLRDRLGPLRRHGPVPIAADLGPIDVVVISHAHPDHFDRRSLDVLEGDPLVIVPRGLEVGLRPRGRRVAGVTVGQAVRIGGGYTVTAVPARHWRWPGAPRAATVGYLIESAGADPRRGGIYFAGDTAPFAAMGAFAARVDVALLPVGSWGPHLSPGHLSPRSAAEVARDLGARVAVPIHWGTLYPPFLERVAGGRLTEPATRFARWAGTLAPALDVRILQPGEATTIEIGRSR